MGRKRFGVVVSAVLVLLAGCARREYVSVDAASPRSYCLRNVRVFDAPRAALVEGLQDVLVRDGRIAAVAPAGMKISGVPDVDGKGGTLLPGLVDLHVHSGAGYGPPWKLMLASAEETLEGFLYAGVTTVLDVGSLTPDVFSLREKVRSGTVLGPHFYAAGPMITAPDSHPVRLLRITLPWYLRWYVIPRLTREVGSDEEARRAVDELLPSRPDVLKIVVDRIPVDSKRIAGEQIAAITERGHANGIRTIAHVGRSVDVVDAVDNGVDALAHDVYPEEISDEAVAKLAARGVPVVATVSVFDSMERFLQKEPAPYLPLETEIARPEVLATLRAVPPSFDRRTLDEVIGTIVGGHEARRKNVAKLRAAGVTVLAGSDSPNMGHFPGAGLHVELRALVESGMTPGEALRAATYENARFLDGEKADFGEVAFGKRADLLLVDGNPLEDIAAVDSIRLVVLDGVMLARRRPSN